MSYLSYKPSFGLVVSVCPPPPPPPPLSITGSSALFPVYIIVTVQIYLSRSAKRTRGSSGASSVTARSAPGPQQTSESSKAAKKGGTAKLPQGRKPPNFNLQQRNSGSLSPYSPLDTPSYRSPVKSPSQYFQICY